MLRTIVVVGGTGPEGSGLAWRWACAGERVVVGSRDELRAVQKAEEIARRCAAGVIITGAENTAAVAAADVVVLCVPFPAQAATLKQLKPALKPGAVVIDTTVPLAATVGGRATRTLQLWQGSAAQQAQEMLGKDFPVAAAFQNIGAELLNAAGKVDCDVIVCADDDRARIAAMELAGRIPGARAIDAGKLENARIVEQITALLISINIRHKVHSAGIRITGIE